MDLIPFKRRRKYSGLNVEFIAAKDFPHFQQNCIFRSFFRSNLEGKRYKFKKCDNKNSLSVKSATSVVFLKSPKTHQQQGGSKRKNSITECFQESKFSKK